MDADGRFGKNPAKMPGYNHLSGVLAITFEVAVLSVPQA